MKSTKKRNKNHYSTKDTERAIIAYCSTDDLSVRSKLYIEQIQPAFNELVDKIVYTYKFTSLENIDVLKDDCKIWLMIKEVEIADVNRSDFLSEAEEREFWAFLLNEVESWQRLKMKGNDQKVLDAVLTLMKNIEDIEIFNKKAVYLYMREITGLNTKQIVGCLNKMRARFRVFKEKWDRGEIK